MAILASTTPPDAREFLATLDLLRDVRPETLDAILAQLEWVSVEGGTVLFEQSDPGNALYFVYAGRLRISVSQPDGTDRALTEVGRGELLGELALLTGKPRSATARAIRDSELARLSRDGFEGLIDESPRALLPLASSIAERLQRRDEGRPPLDQISTLALAPLGRLDLGPFAERLSVALRDYEPALLVDRHEKHADPQRGDPEAEAVAWLHRQETRHRLVLLQADPDDVAWTRRCLRQADRVLLVGDASEMPSLGLLEPQLRWFDDRGTRCAEELVMLQPENASPRNTARWLALRRFSHHHHVRVSSGDDLGRLARRLLGRSVGLVLGGGGARAFTQIGVYRALREARIPVDRVGGTSIGGIMAAQIAAGWDPDRMLEVNRKEWQRTRIDRAFTLPLISLTSAKRSVRMLERMFGDVRLEDLWLPCFCVTVNLSRCEMAIQRAGPVVKWTSATAAPPALQPPVVGEGGELFVDGGVVNNLPSDVMSASGDGPIVAVNVSPFQEMLASPSHRAAPSPLRLLSDSLIRRGHPAFPNIVRLIYRTAKVTGLQAEERNRSLADLYLEPPVERFGLTDYHASDEIVRIGYEYTQQRLAEAPALTLPG